MARPKLGEGETLRLHIKVSEEETKAIDDWRFANRVESRSEAIRRLVQLGLRADSHATITTHRVAESFEVALKMRKRLQQVNHEEMSKEEYFATVAAVVAEEFGELTDALLSATARSLAMLNELTAIHDSQDFSEAIRRADEVKQRYVDQLAELDDSIGGEKARRKLLLEKDDAE